MSNPRRAHHAVDSADRPRKIEREPLDRLELERNAADARARAQRSPAPPPPSTQPRRSAASDLGGQSWRQPHLRDLISRYARTLDLERHHRCYDLTVRLRNACGECLCGSDTCLGCTRKFRPVFRCSSAICRDCQFGVWQLFSVDDSLDSWRLDLEEELANQRQKPEIFDAESRERLRSKIMDLRPHVALSGKRGRPAILRLQRRPLAAMLDRLIELDPERWTRRRLAELCVECWPNPSPPDVLKFERRIGELVGDHRKLEEHAERLLEAARIELDDKAPRPPDDDHSAPADRKRWYRNRLAAEIGERLARNLPVRHWESPIIPISPGPNSEASSELGGNARG